MTPLLTAAAHAAVGPTTNAVPQIRRSQPPCRGNGSPNSRTTKTPGNGRCNHPLKTLKILKTLEDAEGEAPRSPSAPEAGDAETDDAETVGLHISGTVSVADLISKLGTPTSTQPASRHGAPEDEPDMARHVSDYTDEQDTDSIKIPTHALEFLAELPDLGTAHRPGDPGSDEDHAETTPASKLRRSAARVAPARIRATAVPAPSTAERKPTSRRSILLAGRLLVALVAALALAVTGGAWQWSTSKNNRLNTVSALDPHSDDIVDPGGQYGDENFLIVGMDSRAGANANIGAGDASDAGGARSDSVMLVNIPANRKRVVVVSFPRDLATTPIKCEAWNPDTGEYGSLYDEQTGTYSPRMVYTETKLNSSFAFGGPKCLVKEIQKLSGLSINRFIAVDFVGFAKMVEALGGVEVCSTTPLRDYELGTVLARAGRQVIDGATALDYVRARQVTTEVNGDYGRIKRQQLFLSSLLRSLISENTLLSPNKLNNVVNMFIGDSYVDNIRTKDLIKLGRSLQGIAAGHITFVTVPTGVTDENGDEPPRKADMKALFSAIINDDPLPLENDANAQRLGKTPTITATTTAKTPQADLTTENQTRQVTTTSPQDVTVQVSNGTGTTGLAASAAEQLELNGFNVKTPDDYPSSLQATTVFFSPGNEHAAATVASSFATSKVARITGIGHVVQVVLGPDFDFGSVNAPPPSGSSVNLQITRDSDGTPVKLPEDLTLTNAADTTCK